MDVRAWRRLHPLIVDERETIDTPRFAPPIKDEIRELLWRAALSQSGDQRRSTRWTMVAAAAALILIGFSLVFVFFSRDQQEKKPLPSSPVISLRITRPGDQNKETIDHPMYLPIQSPMEGETTIELGEDRITVEKSSRIRFLNATRSSTELELEKGKAIFIVQARKAKNQFKVSSNGYLVRVVGTRFTVEKLNEDGIEVTVAEGIVAVRDLDGTVKRVVAGEHLKFSPSRVLPKKSNTTPLERTISKQTTRQNTLSGERGTRPRVSTDNHKLKTKRWRSWIIDGRHEAAIREMEQYQKENADDTDAWSLLGDAYRKAHRWSEAIAAYRQVIDKAKPEQANRSRFLSGVLLQDQLGNQAEAAHMFEYYLEGLNTTGHLRATAMVRLAISYIALDKTNRARALLESVIQATPDTPAGRNAANLLKNLDD
jgi:hypothetical protein